MHFSEIRGFMLLTILLTCGILLAGRYAPTGMSRPAETMTTAISASERKASTARDVEEAAAVARSAQAVSSGIGSSPLVTTIASSGHSCPAIRRVAPIGGGNGIFRVVCAGPAGDVSYRIDTRRGAATLESSPVA